MPFAWSLNPYTGCVHRCTFCYVRAFERRADRPSDDRYGRTIRVKPNIAEVLRAELARRSWAREEVTIGAATDPYQPAEGRYRLTRACIVELSRARTPDLDHHARPARLARRRRAPGGRDAGRGVGQRLGADARRPRLAHDGARDGATAQAARDRPPARRRRDPHERRDRADPARALRRPGAARRGGEGRARGRRASHLGQHAPPPARDARALPRGARARLAVRERALRAALRGPQLPAARARRRPSREHVRRARARAREQRPAGVAAALRRRRS